MAEGEESRASGPSASASPSSASERKPKPSCASKFDAVYFCYSPVYQTSQYYRFGELDDCFGKWREFYDCITFGTNFESARPEEDKPCMWKLKDFETARKDWDTVFNSPGEE